MFFVILSVCMYSPLNLFGYWTLNKHYDYYYNTGIHLKKKDLSGGMQLLIVICVSSVVKKRIQHTIQKHTLI